MSDSEVTYTEEDNVRCPKCSNRKLLFLYREKRLACSNCGRQFTIICHNEIVRR